MLWNEFAINTRKQGSNSVINDNSYVHISCHW